MKVVTAAEMREIDRRTIEECGIPGIVLMERAGLEVVSRIRELFRNRKVVIVAGSGNNGGDGLVVARNLHNEGWDVGVFLTVSPEEFRGDAFSHYNTAVACGVKMSPVDDLLHHPSAVLSRHSVIVDAILGTGLTKNITGKLAEVIRLINHSGLPVIAVDIPSGISSDSGQAMGDAVRASYTVTFGLPKRGHLLYPGAEYTGKLFIGDIGIPARFRGAGPCAVELLEKDLVSDILPLRAQYSHKGNYGHVLVVAGSKGKTGAALMAARACLRAGAGLVTIGVPESLVPVFESRVTEEMVLGLPDRGNGTLSGKASEGILDFLGTTADILAVGPGIGVTAGTRQLMKTLVTRARSPIVIDADGINALEGEAGIFLKAKVPVILTPHPGELQRLLHGGKGRAKQGVLTGIRDIEKNRIDTALKCATKTRTYLVLKGSPTIIGTPDGSAFVNPTGNPGMATAGAGDVLTGMIAGFLAQTQDQLNACTLGVFLHGFSGDIAASGKGEYSLIATDIIEAMPAAFSSLRSRDS